MRFTNSPIDRRPILWILLACYVFLLGGLPAVDPPKTSGVNHSEERFPCENCPCGCSTAEFCWDQCCCYSDSEKIAWAVANGVTPPAFLADRVAQAKAATSKSVVACSTLPADQPARKCCCCSAKPKEPAKPKESARTNKDEQHATTSVVLFWKAAQCRGVQSFWKLLSMTVVAHQPNRIAPLAMPLGQLVITDDSTDSIKYAPVPPVPWA